MSALYAPPLDQLLTLGESRANSEWPNYSELGIGQRHVADLVRMAVDETLFDDPEAPKSWAPLHALHALGQLGDAAAVEPLLARLGSFHGDDWDDFFSEDLAPVMALIGAPALPALAAFLTDRGRDPWARGYVANAIRAIGDKHPEQRSECVGILTRQLEKAAENGPVLNALIISDLIDLKAVEAAPVIEAAFSSGAVDETFVGDGAYVKYQLGLGPEPPKKRRFHRGSPVLQVQSNPRQRAEARRKKAKAERNRRRRR
jgi:hypothetical protein